MGHKDLINYGALVLEWACPRFLQSTRLESLQKSDYSELIFQWPQDRSCSYSIFELDYDQENACMYSSPHSYAFGLNFFFILAADVSGFCFRNHLHKYHRDVGHNHGCRHRVQWQCALQKCGAAEHQREIRFRSQDSSIFYLSECLRVYIAPQHFHELCPPVTPNCRV